MLSGVETLMITMKISLKLVLVILPLLKIEGNAVNITYQFIASVSYPELFSLFIHLIKLRQIRNWKTVLNPQFLPPLQ